MRGSRAGGAGLRGWGCTWELGGRGGGGVVVGGGKELGGWGVVGWGDRLQKFALLGGTRWLHMPSLMTRPR